MSKQIKKVGIVLLIVLLMSVFFPIFVFADNKSNLEEAEHKLEETEQKLEEINKEIEGIQDEQKETKNAKTYTQNRINKVKWEIAELNADITKVSAELLTKQQELAQKKVEIAETDELFKERLRAMYVRRHHTNPLATILALESYSQVSTATNTLLNITKADTDLLLTLDVQREIIEEEEAEIQKSLNTLEEKQNQLEEKQKELATLISQLDYTLTTLEAEEQAAKETQSEIYAEYLAAKKAMEEELASIQGSGTFVGGEFLWPVPYTGYVTSGFGWRTLYGAADYHTGIDISAWQVNGKPIVASMSGRVVRAIYSNRGYGNYVMLDHGGNNFTLYGHCSSLAVKVGDWIEQGETIAYVGSTGNSTGPHLHFEIRLDGVQVNPYPYIKDSRPNN